MWGIESVSLVDGIKLDMWVLAATGFIDHLAHGDWVCGLAGVPHGRSLPTWIPCEVRMGLQRFIIG